MVDQINAEFDIAFKTIILRLENRKKSFGLYNVHTPHSFLNGIVSLDVLRGLPWIITQHNITTQQINVSAKILNV